MSDRAMSDSAGIHSWRYIGACAALALVLHEVHELAHTGVGRVLCGGWGARDFNSWTLPDGCDTWVPTTAGPVLTYAVIWIGYVLLRRYASGGASASATADRLAGLALVLMANPFARLFTAAMGGGDEGVLVRAWLGLPRGPLATAITFAGVALLTTLPLVAAWRALPVARRLPAYVVMLLAPMLLTGILLFAVGNRLLAAGVLAEPVILGAPLLVWLVTLLSAGALVWLRRAILIHDASLRDEPLQVPGPA
jgi:hypothetical protein